MAQRERHSREGSDGEFTGAAARFVRAVEAEGNLLYDVRAVFKVPIRISLNQSNKKPSGGYTTLKGHLVAPLFKIKVCVYTQFLWQHPQPSAFFHKAVNKGLNVPFFFVVYEI